MGSLLVKPFSRQGYAMSQEFDEFNIELEDVQENWATNSSFSLFLAKTKYFVWRTLVICLLGPIYVLVIREGLAFLIPALGQRMSKIPGMSFLKYLELTYQLDLAFVMAIFICFGVWTCWDIVLARFLLSDHGQDQEPGWNVERRSQLLHGLAFVLIISDMGLFYLAVSQFGWGQSRISLAALIATVAYVAVLILVSYFNVQMRFNIRSLEQR